MMIQKRPYSFLRLLVKGQDHSFFKNLTGVFCTVGGTLVIAELNHMQTFPIQNLVFILQFTELKPK
jgi:hypothetical protein